MAIAGITLDQLVRPNKELECILRDIVCKYSCIGAGVIIKKDGNNLIFELGNQTTVIPLGDMIEQMLINGITVEDSKLYFRFGETETVWDFAEQVQMHETVTTLVENQDGTYTYTNEFGTQTIIKTTQGKAYNLQSSFGNNDINILIPA